MSLHDVPNENNFTAVDVDGNIIEILGTHQQEIKVNSRDEDNSIIVQRLDEIIMLLKALNE